MNNFKTILLTLVLSIGFIFPSCEKDHVIDLCGDTASYRYFDINGLDALIYKNDINGLDFFDSSDTLVFSDDLGIFLLYEADYHASLSHSIGLINTAMACTIIGGYDGSKTEKLEDISIITLNDFDEDHLANSSINDLLEVQFFNLGEEDLPLVDYLANQTENIKYQTLQLRLEKAPELNSEFHCRIQVKLSTGEMYVAENSPVYFKN